MKIKKMLAVLSAITIMGSYSMSCINPCSFRATAEETISDAASETCGVEVSLSAASDPMPEDVHILGKCQVLFYQLLYDRNFCIPIL